MAFEFTMSFVLTGALWQSPVSVSRSTVLNKVHFVFSQRVALVWLELHTVHDGPGPRGVSHPG